MALIIIMIIASYRVFLLQAHQVQRVLHPIQLLHRLIPFCVKTNGRPPKLSTKGIQTVSLVSLFDWLFMMPLKLISRTPPTSWDLMGALVILLQT